MITLCHTIKPLSIHPNVLFTFVMGVVGIGQGYSCTHVFLHGLQWHFLKIMVMEYGASKNMKKQSVYMQRFNCMTECVMWSIWFREVAPKDGQSAGHMERYEFWVAAGFPKTFCTPLDILTDEAWVLRWTLHVFVGHLKITFESYILNIGQNVLLMFQIDFNGLFHPILSGYTSL